MVAAVKLGTTGAVAWLAAAVAAAVAATVFATLPATASRGSATETPPAVPEIPPVESILSGLAVVHPRLQLTPSAVTELRARISTDPTLAGWYSTLHAQAHDLIAKPPVVYEKPDGLRLLEVSREALRRLQLLGLVWQIDGEPEIALRGWQELEAISGFANWNPIHFLDTAEMTHAAAIGLDWLYDALSPPQRTVVIDAIRTKGLIPARDAYNGTAPAYYSWWQNSTHNWNQVVNGGIAVGALAVADVDPELAAYDLHEALSRLPRALAHYAPDGGWPEGVSYWLYAGDYTVYALSSLETALGTDFGLSSTPGFDRSGDVAAHMSGPTGERWNWADDGEPRSAPAAPFLFWMADRFGRGDFQAYQLAHAQPEPHDVVWYRPLGAEPAQVPLYRHFEGIDAVTMRSSWGDPRATFVGVKGGRPRFNHNQLDIGSYVLEAEGQRWAMDLGKDSYGLPGYFNVAIGGPRWTYYRNRAEGHNTLVLAPGAEADDQYVRAHAPVERFTATAGHSSAVIDMGQAYWDRDVRRGVRLDGRDVLVQDELALDEPTELWWFMHTRAGISLTDGGRTALLSRGGETLRVRLLAPSVGHFEVMAAEPLPTSPNPEGQNPNAGVSKLALHLEGVTATTIAVAFEPDETATPEAFTIVPLSSWDPPTTTSTTTTTGTSTTTTTGTSTSTSTSTTTAAPDRSPTSLPVAAPEPPARPVPLAPTFAG